MKSKRCVSTIAGIFEAFRGMTSVMCMYVIPKLEGPLFMIFFVSALLSMVSILPQTKWDYLNLRSERERKLRIIDKI